MQFDSLRSAFATSSDSTATIPHEWGQGRATFGGVLVGLIFDRMKAEMHETRTVRSLMVSFVAPAVPGEPLTLTGEILREGKAVTQVEGRALQNGNTVAVVLGSFGQGRDSAVSVAADPAPEVGEPQAGQALPYIENVTPEFTRHIEMRYAIGSFPFSGNDSREMGGWMRFRETPEKLEDTHLVALADAWPPTVLPHLKKPAPASSLAWTLEFVYPQPALQPDDYLLYRASIDQARDGYGHTQAQIWNRQGELVALSRQTVTVFG
ncbi:thioesterase family protein [Marinobacteraceae bacterium S3BR75-40.1]